MTMPLTLPLMPSAKLSEVLTRLEAEKDRRERTNRLAHYRPYPKQLEFYAAGAKHRERLLMAANQSGKTYSGAYEVAYHLTGLYPDWWPGHRFTRPIEVWAGSNTSESTRDTVQANLIGPPPIESDWGTGSIPQSAIIDYSRRQGVANALDTVSVRHVSGGTSTVGFKSYDQGRQKWQGTKKDVVWFDEEPPMDIYMEGLTRTNAVDDGIALVTFTPLLGMSEVVMLFLDEE
jgi:phage terminase large subunit-like protein